MRIAHAPGQVERQPRAAAVGTFDGVHRGHRAVVQSVIDTGLAATVVTFDPHPRVVLGNRVEQIASIERRLELLAGLGVETTLVATFTTELMRLEPEEFAESYLRATGVEAVAAGEDFRFEILAVPEVPGVSSSAIRAAIAAGDVKLAAELLGRPYELDGIVVAGDQRGGTLGFPTANLALDAQLICPQFGIYAGSALDHLAAVSIGTNPHYGGTERRIEPFLLDYSGDLYGKRLVVELWQRLREEAVFETEEELIEQIGRDVEATRAAVRPV